MPHELKFKIGDVSIALGWLGKQAEWQIPAAYRRFLFIGRTDIRLRLQLGVPESPVGERMFDSPPIWSFHRQNGTSMVKMFSDQDRLARDLVIPDHHRHADLYFHHPDGGFLDPFFGPTMELLMINYLARQRGVIIHACGVDVKGRGILFAGESGAGKSTIAGLWAADPDAMVLSDDRVILRRRGEDYWIFGTPWHGEAHFGEPSAVKLDRIFFLGKGQKHSIRKVASSKAVVQLLQASFPPHWDKSGMDFTMSFFEELVGGMDCRQFNFKPEKSAVEYIKAKVSSG